MNYRARFIDEIVLANRSNDLFGTLNSRFAIFAANTGIDLQAA